MRNRGGRVIGSELEDGMDRYIEASRVAPATPRWYSDVIEMETRHLER